MTKPSPSETHDAAMSWVMKYLGLAPLRSVSGAANATDAAGARYRISGRIDPNDRHVDLGSTDGQPDYDWLVVIRFAGAVGRVDNVWKIKASVAASAADPNGVLRLTDRLLSRGTRMSLGIIDVTKG